MINPLMHIRDTSSVAQTPQLQVHTCVYGAQKCFTMRECSGMIMSEQDASLQLRMRTCMYCCNASRPKDIVVSGF